MENADVFERLKEMGAARAAVEFSGGNDEGGTDGILLYDAASEVTYVDRTPFDASVRDVARRVDVEHYVRKLGQ